MTIAKRLVEGEVSIKSQSVEVNNHRQPLFISLPTSDSRPLNMRLDLFLKLSRLAMRRTVAAEMCKAGRVSVNDAAAKPGREIKPGDLISIKRRGEILRVRVAIIPAGNVSKSQAASLYEILSVEPFNELNDLLKSDNHEDR